MSRLEQALWMYAIIGQIMLALVVWLAPANTWQNKSGIRGIWLDLMLIVAIPAWSVTWLPLLIGAAFFKTGDAR